MTIWPENTYETNKLNVGHGNHLFSSPRSSKKKKKKRKKERKKTHVWRNGVNFRKIGKVPNDHPSYVMWSAKK